MKWQHGKDNSSNSLKHQVIGISKIAVPLIVIVFTLLIILYSGEKKSQETKLIQELVKQESAYLQIAALGVERDIASMAKDLLTVKDFTSLALDNNNIKHIEIVYLNMAANYQIYDQVRYIDENGMERVRINYNDGKAEVVPIQQLQNKKDRYYYQNSFDLECGQIYISPLDLNIENGELEIPYKPMIRLATPVTDSSGDPKGIVVLNYLAKNILDVVKSVYRDYGADLSLVNQEGFFLIHEEDEAKEFGFMFEDGQEYQLKYVNDEMYRETSSTLSGWHKNERGLFNYTRIYPFRNSYSTCKEDNDIASLHTSRSWLLITHVQQPVIHARLKAMRPLSQLALIIVIVSVFLVLISLSYVWYQRGFEQKFIKSLAHNDQLTGAYSRGWGLKLLHEIIAKAKKRKVMVGLLFIDLDKFKLVNDTYGHKAGDAVLIESVKRIKRLLRHDDVVVRLGGDEFLVILPSVTDLSVPQMIAKRIHIALKDVIPIGNINLFIDSSIGISIYPQDGHLMHELISASDKAMYQAKTNKEVPYVEFSQIIPTG